MSATNENDKELRNIIADALTNDDPNTINTLIATGIMPTNGLPGSIPLMTRARFAKAERIQASLHELTPGYATALDDVRNIWSYLADKVLVLTNSGELREFDFPHKSNIDWVAFGAALRAAPTILDRVQDAAVGLRHAVALRDGRVWVWGDNRSGQVGANPKVTKHLATPTEIEVPAEVVGIAAGSEHCLAVTRDGVLWAWGENEKGELGDGTHTNRTRPVKIITNVKEGHATTSRSFAVLHDGTVWRWGKTEFFNWGHKGEGNRVQPIQVFDRTRTIASGTGWFTLALRDDANVWGWGSHHDGALGMVKPGTWRDEQRIITKAKSIAVSETHSLIIREDDSLWMSGGNDPKKMRSPSFPLPTRVLRGVTRVVTFRDYSLAADAGGKLWPLN